MSSVNAPRSPPIKIELIQPKVEVHLGEDLTCDYNDFNVNETVRGDCNALPPLPQCQEIPSELTSDDVAEEEVAASNDVDSKSELTFILKDRTYECTVCAKCFVNEDGLNDHMFYECGKELHMKCTYCSFQTEFMDDMRSHLTLKHKDSTDPNFLYQKEQPVPALERPVCTGCGKSFKCIMYLKRHLKCCEKSNIQIVMHKCPVCFYETKWKDSLRRHISQRHSMGVKERPACTGCGKSFKNSDSLKRHVKYCEKLNSEIVKSKCFYCSHETKYKNYLREHIKRVHPNGEIERQICFQCGKSYKNKDCLKKHMKYCGKPNNEIVKFKCFHCSHETKWKDSLLRHIKHMHPVDIIDRPTCTACGKSLKNENGLKHHIKYCEKWNEEVVKHECPICFYVTKWKVHLARHIKLVHSVVDIERPICPKCRKSYKNIDSLRHHLRFCEKSNKDTVKLKCSICLYETKWKNHLKGHYRRLHPVGAKERQICFECGTCCKSSDSLKEHVQNCKSNNVIIKQEE